MRADDSTREITTYSVGHREDEAFSRTASESLLQLTVKSTHTLGESRCYPLDTKPTTEISCLPNDILLLVIGFMHVKDILTLRQTSKRFFSLTKLRWIWSDAVKRHIINKGLPLPAARNDIRTLSAEHLETRTIHAAKFHDNWYSKRPAPQRAMEFCVKHPPEAGREAPCKVSQVLFLPGRNGEFLIVLADGIITCWEVPLDGSEAYRFAEYEDARGNNIRQVIVNEDSTHPVQLAYFVHDDARGTAIVCTLSLDTFHGQFGLNSSISGSKHQCTPLYHMRGDDIVMGDPLYVWHFTAGEAAGRNGYYRLPPSPMVDSGGVVHEVKLVGQFVVSVRSFAIELFGLPQWSPKDNAFKNAQLYNASLCSENSAAREAVIIARSQVDGGCYSWPSGPVSIITRYSDDGFEMIKQYDLLPNPRGQRHGPEASNVDELPFSFSGGYTRTISVAPSCCGLRIGRNGKGFWVQTRNVQERHSVYPARCLVGFDVAYCMNEEDEGRTADMTERKRDANGLVPPETNLHVCEGELYSRRISMNDVMWRRYPIVAADLEDTVGRVAVGERDGKVVVLDYA